MSESYDITIIMPPKWNVREPWTAPAYVTEALRRDGYTVQFLDFNIELYHACKELGYGALWQDDAYFHAWMYGHLNHLVHLLDLDRIQGSHVGISVTQTSISFAVLLANQIRAKWPRRRIIFGGHSLHFPDEAALIPLESADAVCKGEGERTICETMARGFEKLHEVAGLYLPNGGGWRLSSERPQEKDLDGLAWPRFDGLDQGLYEQRLIPVMGSRGCIGRCLFCPDRYRTPGFRTRSADSQVDELEYLSATFDVDHFPYNDPLLNGDLKVLEGRADEILRRGLEVRYGGNMRVRSDMPGELFEKLRRSGMAGALVGVESGSARVLRDMRKGLLPEMASDFIRKLHHAGIRTELNFILGFPSEGDKEFQETLDFIRDNREHIGEIVSIMPMLMQPSDLFDRREQFNVVINGDNPDQDWHVEGGQNTLEIRQERVRRFTEFAADLGLIGRTTMSDRMDKAPHRIPRIGEVAKAYAARWENREDFSEDERACVEKCLGQLRAAAREALHELSPIRVVKRTVDSIRNDGLAPTLKRAKEWVQFRLT